MDQLTPSPTGASVQMRRRLVVTILLIVAIWPAIHFGLYQFYAIDPWKLCGWAMYTRPRSTFQLGVFEVRDEKLFPIDTSEAPYASEVKRLGRWRGVIGKLQSMDSLGEMLLTERSDLDHVRILVRRIGFNCSTAMLDSYEDSFYDYRR